MSDDEQRADDDPDAGLKHQLYVDVARGIMPGSTPGIRGVRKDHTPDSLWITRAAMMRAGPTGTWCIANLLGVVLLGRELTDAEQARVAGKIHWLMGEDPTADDDYRHAVGYAMRQAGASWEEVAMVDSQLDRRRTDKAAVRKHAERVRKQVERYAVRRNLEPPGRYHRPPVTKEGRTRKKEGHEDKKGDRLDDV